MANTFDIKSCVSGLLLLILHKLEEFLLPKIDLGGGETSI